MKFHVGQRVRKVAARKREHRYLIGSLHDIPTGTEGVVVRGQRDDGQYEVRFGEYPYVLCVMEYQIEPLDDRPEAGSWDEVCAITRGWRPGVVHCDS